MRAVSSRWLAVAFLSGCGTATDSNSASSPIDSGPSSRGAAADATNGEFGQDGSLPAIDGPSASSSGGSPDGSLGAPDASNPRDGGHAEADTSAWVLTWSDEFDGPDGSAVDPNKWVHDVGGNGWGNNELEYYTDGTHNAVVTGGNLLITAMSGGVGADAGGYTSARVRTQGKFEQLYGRFEARIQMPYGRGIWPAFWLLGGSGTWPNCGEIDIMETIGSDVLHNHGSLHAPGFNNVTGTYTSASQLSDDFHIYSAEWDPATIRFYVDGNLFETQMPQTAKGTWEFDNANDPFYIILNVAVGGTWPGSPDSTTVFPQMMKVDWVRVYERGTPG